MKIKRKIEEESELGDLKYVKKFALLPSKSLLYTIWMEQYIEVWSYSYSWIREPNRVRYRSLGWNKDFILSIEEYNVFIKDGLDKNRQKEIIDGEKCKITMKPPKQIIDEGGEEDGSYKE